MKPHNKASVSSFVVRTLLIPSARAIIAIAREDAGQGGSNKRRRTSAQFGGRFPTTDRTGRKINQGPGGDLSYLPAGLPLISKQSCKYTLLGPEGGWASAREVIQPQCVPFSPYTTAVVTPSHVRQSEQPCLQAKQPKHKLPELHGVDWQFLFFAVCQPQDIQGQPLCGANEYCQHLYHQHLKPQRHPVHHS